MSKPSIGDIQKNHNISTDNLSDREVDRWDARSETPQPGIRKMALTAPERISMTQNYRHVTLPATTKMTSQAVSEFIEQSERWFRTEAPRWLATCLWEWKRDPFHPSVLIIDNFPTEPLPPTPIDNRSNLHKPLNLSEMILVGALSMVAEIVGMKNERNGALVQPIAPVAGKEQALTNEGTAALGFHHEHAHTGRLLGIPTTPISHLGILALRDDPSGIGKTAVADAAAALQRLSPATRSVLSSRRFNVRVPMQTRAGLSAQFLVFEKVAILHGPLGAEQLSAAFYGDLTEAIDVGGELALRELDDALNHVRYDIESIPGRLLLIDNRLALHARVPFTPRLDGTDRLMLRAFGVQSPFQIRGWRTDPYQILDPAKYQHADAEDRSQ